MLTLCYETAAISNIKILTPEEVQKTQKPEQETNEIVTFLNSSWENYNLPVEVNEKEVEN